MMLLKPFEIISKSDIRLREYEAGEKVFNMGDHPHSIFFVCAGQVQLQRYTKNGNLIIIHRTQLNEYFAEASLFSTEYHCDAIVNEKTIVAAISKLAILELMNTDPEFSTNVTAYFANQVQNYRRLLELRSIKSARERVYAGLQEGLHTGNVMSFAAILGLTHEATYRAFNKLVKLGLIMKKQRGKYKLL